MIFGHRALSNLSQVLILSITSAVGALLLAIGVQAEAPKKQQIAFYSNRDGNFEIYVMDVDGNNPRRLTINPAIDAGPSWGPRGKKIAFHSNRGGNYDIFCHGREWKQSNQPNKQSPTRMTVSLTGLLTGTASPINRRTPDTTIS